MARGDLASGPARRAVTCLRVGDREQLDPLCDCEPGDAYERRKSPCYAKTMDHLACEESPRCLAWQRAHEDLSRLAQSRSRLDWQEGQSLLAALRAGVHLHLGYGGFAEYVERLFGYKPRWTEERLRVAEALEGLSELQQSLRDGAINWSTARELTRVAIADTEHEWLEVARGRTLRQIEDLVAGHAAGDRPHDRRDPNIQRHVLRFDVAAETFATFREALAKVQRDAGAKLDDDAALLLVARYVLGGPVDAGRASYQLALTVCEACRRGWQQGQGERIELAPEIVEMVECDAQDIGRLSSSAHVGEPCTDVGEPSAHVGDIVSGETGGHRAHQRTRPAVRRDVMRRDGGRCVVPGCTNAVFLDVHHIVLRSEGGSDDPDRLIVLCGAHHRAQHRGQLLIEGSVSTRLVFRHADGTAYGAAVSPRVASVYEEAFSGLRRLGFREGGAALDRARGGGLLANAAVEHVLRAALATLTAPARAPAHG